MRHWRGWWVPLGAAALVLAPACADGPDTLPDIINDYHGLAAGKNVTAHKNPADTAARVSVQLHWIDSGWTSVATKLTGPPHAYSFTYNVDVTPHGTITAIRILRDTVVKATVCDAAPCVASGALTNVTDSTLYRLMRNVATVVRVYTDSDPAGAAAGAITPYGP